MLVSILVLFFLFLPYPSIRGGKVAGLAIESEGEFSENGQSIDGLNTSSKQAAVVLCK